MINLFLTILCSSSLAIILKVNSNHKGDTILLLAGNYFSASIISLILFLSDTNSTSPIEIIPLGIFLSLLFVGSIFAFSKSVNLSGAALSTVSSRLSVFVPIILSILIYNEFPDVYQIIGLLLTAITILLFYFAINSSSKDRKENNKFIYLLFILFGIGAADFFMKVFQENWGSSDKAWFLFWIFFFSFLITVYITIRKKKNINYKTILMGIGMGIPNIFSSYFLIEALKSFPAVFVFPFVNISIIIFTSLVVKIFWNEIWNKYSRLALISGIISILFLSI
ncbi:MAG: hypothetical protein OQJ81_13000 [Melioribacteraceae bacterium]|nr:hypothetical protein [Melioribacteraceae bacterium]